MLLYQIVNIVNDATLFQVNINAVYKWSIEWKMPFNEKRYQAISFGKLVPSKPVYEFGSTTLDSADSIKYLGVPSSQI